MNNESYSCSFLTRVHSFVTFHKNFRRNSVFSEWSLIFGPLYSKHQFSWSHIKKFPNNYITNLFRPFFTEITFKIILTFNSFKYTKIFHFVQKYELEYFQDEVSDELLINFPDSDKNLLDPEIDNYIDNFSEVISNTQNC